MAEIIDYLEGAKYHEFPEGASLIECGMETAMFAEFNWVVMMEEEGISEYNIFEENIQNSVIKEDAIVLAEASSKDLPNKFAKKINHTWSYIEGIFAKFVVELKATYDRNRFLASKEGRDRIVAGAKLLASQDATVNGYLITADNAGLKVLADYFNSFNKINAELNSMMVKGYDKDKEKELIKETENLKNKGALLGKLGREDNWKVTVNLVENAEKNFVNYMAAKKSAKAVYDYSKNLCNVMIANVKALKKIKGKEYDAYVNKCTKLYNIILRCNAIINSVYLSALKRDYNTNCKIILKCYNAGGKALKNVKESFVEDKPEAVTYSTESIESIFN